VTRAAPQGAKPGPIPSFSIATPSLNQLEFLRVCVASIVSQGYPRVDQIVIDGGSTDGTSEFLGRGAGVVSYWQSEPDQGQSNALNIALQQATGDWIGWQNADDFYLPGALWQAAEAIVNHPEADVVVGDTLLVDDCGVLLGAIGVCPVPAPRWLEGFWPYNQSVFIRRSLLERTGPVDESLHLHMDTDLLARVAQLGPRVVYLEASLGAHRKHVGAKTVGGEASPASQRERGVLEQRYGRNLWPHGRAARLRHRLRWHVIRVAAFREALSRGWPSEPRARLGSWSCKRNGGRGASRATAVDRRAVRGRA
jgi:glycosyltransferase involved in cell wall biosynthesis